MPCCGGVYLLTFLYVHGIITGEVHDFPREGKRWRLAFALLYQRGDHDDRLSDVVARNHDLYACFCSDELQQEVK